ncbi:TRAP transporter small permease [Neorhizobium sp. Rsf11]|uniref:TRAP transporter small permease protein n=2 Tax=Neorhizobium TaxID=1525371 RepID=A0ABV0MAY1_9HYPH|nr:TRAP transporter small permease [Neorhizobium petrolearium]MCC2613826.1 TRAP transporter small permease [Neorhizobium petrolearium]WGI72135.1 TRAP transporter small permease [Neorhizobium petrolearium]
MQTYARILGMTFGIMMILLSLAITAETLLRKFFSYSLGGIDELGGYAIAIAAPLAFTVALVENSHIRINQLTALMPKTAQAVLNGISAITIALLAGYFFYFTVDTVIDTQTYQSIAQTPWATPLIYPQTVWLVAMATFPIAALVFAGRAVMLMSHGEWQVLNRHFGPVSAQEELQAELDDLKKREGAAQ